MIEAIGEDAGEWKAGDRVGVGWHGGNCFRCDPCRRGDFVNCRFLKIPGISYDGGYAAHVIAPVEALAHIPDALRPEEAAPLMCAGITTFNALRHSGAGPGDLVGIQGIGGLGHLGIQFAAKFGYDVVAIGRGEDKQALALKLGARRYIDSGMQDVAAELNKEGGAAVILATAPDPKAIGALVDGLGVRGRLVIVGASAEPVRGLVVPADRRTAHDYRMAVGNVEGLRGHAEIRGADGSARDDRNISNRAGGASLREDDHR